MLNGLTLGGFRFFLLCAVKAAKLLWHHIPQLLCTPEQQLSHFTIVFPFPPIQFYCCKPQLGPAVSPTCRTIYRTIAISTACVLAFQLYAP